MAQPQTALVATIPIALIAIGEHIEENRLPSPNTITLPSRDDDKLTLFISDFGSERWINSLAVDQERRTALRPGAERIDISGRIHSAIGGVRISLRFVRLTAGPILQAVKS